MGIMFDIGPPGPEQNNSYFTPWIGSAFMILSVLGLVLRFYAKYRVGQGIIKEDWLLLLGFVFSAGLFAGEIYGKLELILRRHKFKLMFIFTSYQKGGTRPPYRSGNSGCCDEFLQGGIRYSDNIYNIFVSH